MTKYQLTPKGTKVLKDLDNLHRIIKELLPENDADRSLEFITDSLADTGNPAYDFFHIFDTLDVEEEPISHFIDAGEPFEAKNLTSDLWGEEDIQGCTEDWVEKEWVTKFD